MNAVLFALLGGVIYRVRGMAHPLKFLVRRPITQILFSIPYAYVAYLLTHSYTVALAVLVLTTLAVLQGHGQYFLRGAIDRYVEPERLDFIVRPFFGKDPRSNISMYGLSDYYIRAIKEYGATKLYCRNVFGFVVTGCALCFPCSIVLASNDSYGLGAFLLLSGAGKALGYVISDKLGHGTEGGEFLTGMFLWAAIGAIIFM